MREVEARALAQKLRSRGAVAIVTTAEVYGVLPPDPAHGPWIVVGNGTVIRDREELR